MDDGAERLWSRIEIEDDGIVRPILLGAKTSLYFDEGGIEVLPAAALRGGDGNRGHRRAFPQNTHHCILNCKASRAEACTSPVTSTSSPTFSASMQTDEQRLQSILYEKSRRG